MSKSDFVAPKCCVLQSIATMDYKYPAFEEKQMWKVNRTCLKCNTHCFGFDGDVKQYTGKEWDNSLEGALKD